WCASLPFAELPTDFRFVRLWLSAALLLLGCLCFLCRRHTKLPVRLTALLCVVMLLANSFVYELRSPQMKVTVAASAEGVSVVASYAGHGAVIGCGADSSQTALILRRCGVRHLDTVMLLSLSNRESQQAAEIITAYHPSAVVLPSGEALDGLLQESLACAGQYWIAGAQAQVSLWNCSASVTFESGTASLLAEDFSALICGDSADLRRCLPGKTQALICSSLPKGEERLQTSMTVLCRYPNTLKTYSTARRGMPVIAGGGEDLVLQPMKDGSVKIGRND
ncbi:MAG: hypothetical protein PHU79_09135, partial [Oscillospiraceae bacterium]|nr:hypothetical protein [Oscillospiraceae bacterium]